MVAVELDTHYCPVNGPPESGIAKEGRHTLLLFQNSARWKDSHDTFPTLSLECLSICKGSDKASKNLKYLHGVVAK